MKKNQPRARRPRARPKRAAATPDLPRYRFQLYVTGTSPRSTAAVANIRSLCEQHLPGRYDLEVIDMYQQPEQAAVGGIIAAPTLIKRFPAPLMRMVGDLANRDKLLVKLNLTHDGLGSLPISA